MVVVQTTLICSTASEVRGYDWTVNLQSVDIHLDVLASAVFFSYLFSHLLMPFSLLINGVVALLILN